MTGGTPRQDAGGVRNPGTPDAPGTRRSPAGPPPAVAPGLSPTGRTGRAEEPQDGLGPLPAGPFGRWLRAAVAAVDRGADAEVPCGDCTACCRAAQFVLIEPDETETIAHIPAPLLFPAPRKPGHKLLGHDRQGRCPMLGEHGCSIYDHRPRACRSYDCRIFTATGTLPDLPAQQDIARRARRWRFTTATPGDRLLQQAVVAAADHLRTRPVAASCGTRSGGPMQLAVQAVQLHRLFVDDDPAGGRPTLVAPGAEAVTAELERLARRSGPVPQRAR